MKLLAVLGGLAYVSAQTVEPVFPGNSRQAVEKVQGILDSVTRSGSNEKGTATGSGSERAVLDQLIARGKQTLVEQLLAEKQQESAAAHSYIAVKKSALKSKTLGGCARFFEVCPSGYSDQGSYCVNNGEGFCGTFDKSWSNEKKAEFAWRCNADFACQSQCKTNYGVSCPETWSKSASGACIAPSSYNGICSPSTNFDEFDGEGKASWAALCDASWPCL